MTVAASVERVPESVGDPLELLDGIIKELETAREQAILLFTNVGPLERATLAAALRELDDKLSEAKAKRDEVRQRVERTARIRALAAEMNDLRDQAEAASRGELDPAQAARVRSRIEEIRGEAQKMKTGQ